MTCNLYAAAWNVRGLGDPHGALTVKNWLRRF